MAFFVKSSWNKNDRSHVNEQTKFESDILFFFTSRVKCQEFVFDILKCVLKISHINVIFCTDFCYIFYVTLKGFNFS